jgi:tetratricopeptide (TPR) repeat protein
MLSDLDIHLNIQSIRRALRNMNSLKDLADNPLTGLSLVESHRKTAGYTDSYTGRGLALRDILKDAIHSLRPENLPEDRLEKRWRPFLVLNSQFIEGRSPEFLQEQLCISRGTYFAEQNRALHLLADFLIQQEEQQIDASSTKISKSNGNASYPFLTPPRPTYPFIGRENLLASVKKVLLSPNPAVSIALNGLPGIGKTRIALEMAYDDELRSQFPDGVLWVGLGCNPDIPTLLGIWATALNIPPEWTAACLNLNDRIALLHAAIGERKMLLIIDDAWQSEAALAFKLGGPHCAHVLTTRLLDIAVDFAGERVVTVHEMEPQDSLDLLNYFSPGPLSENPEAVHSLIQSVGNLPLAIILMGRYLHKLTFSAQSRRLSEALLSLKQAQYRLGLSQQISPLEINSGIPAGTPLSLQAVIGLSDSILDSETHRVLIDLSVFPPKPNNFSEEAALAVSNAKTSCLDMLVDVGLMECLPPDRYTFHQTIADYARLQAGNHDSTLRLIDYFTNYAENNKAIHTQIDKEMVNLIAACKAADQMGLHENLIRLANGLYNYLETRGFYQISLQLLQEALEAAKVQENAEQLAILLFNLGDLEVRCGKFHQAKQHLWQSIEISQSIPNHFIETSAYFSLGNNSMYRGDWFSGRLCFEKAIANCHEWGFQNLEDWILAGLGFVSEEFCEFQAGLKFLEQAQCAFQKTGNQRVMGWIHFIYSLIYLPMGEFASARRHAKACAAYYNTVGDQRGNTWLTYFYGRLARKEGDYAAASDFFDEARRSFEKLGDLMGLGFAIHNQGLVANELGSLEAAVEAYQHALEIFHKNECGVGESQCYQSQGEFYRQQGDMINARNMLQKAYEFRNKNNYHRGKAKALSNLSLVQWELGEIKASKVAAQQAVQIAREIGAPSNLAYSLTCQGEIALASGDWREAKTAFQKACDIRTSLKQAFLIWEPLGGLARTAMLEGDLQSAQSLAQQALSILEEAPRPAGVNRPEWTFNQCKTIVAASPEPPT